jgi:hypothetical protein|tara:strand:+ start:3604 stop:4065 length:462 start_codon:yes stop_codon:yes gene_type:complete
VTKSEAISQLKAQLDKQISVMQSALADSEESASGDETKSEGKYDTRAVEASYLAQAQDAQLALAEVAAATFSRFEAEDYTLDDEIGVGAFVEVDEDGEIRFFFLAPTGGGQTLDYLGCELTVITPDSRLYQELVGKKMGAKIENPALLVTGLE